MSYHTWSFWGWLQFTKGQTKPMLSHTTMSTPGLYQGEFQLHATRRSDRSKRHALFRVLVPASLLFQQYSVINVEWAINKDPKRKANLLVFFSLWMIVREETRNFLTVQRRSGNCTSVLIIWIPAFIKMSSVLCSVPFVNTSFPICPCWDYGCYEVNSWH